MALENVTETGISNLALSHLGSGKEIQFLDTEDSDEAATCRRFYRDAVDATLRDFPWPFARKFVALGLVQEDPTDEWGFSYRYPADCLRVRRIVSGRRNDTRQSRVPFLIGQDSQGLLIFTDREDAELEYTLRALDPTRYPPDFVMAFSFRLAAYIAPRITGGDPFKLGNRAIQFYAAEISKAQATAAEEDQVDQPVESEFIRTREGEEDGFRRRS